MSGRRSTARVRRLLRTAVSASPRGYFAFGYIVLGVLFGASGLLGTWAFVIGVADDRWNYAVLGAVLAGLGAHGERQTIVGWINFRRDTQDLLDGSRSVPPDVAPPHPDKSEAPQWDQAQQEEHLARLAEGVSTQLVKALARSNEPAPIKQGPVIAAAIRGALYIDLIMAGVVLDGPDGLTIRDALTTSFVPAHSMVRWMQRHPRATVDRLLRRGRPTEHTMMRQLRLYGWLQQDRATRHWRLGPSGFAMTYDNLSAAFREGHARDATTAAVAVLYAALGMLGADACSTADTNGLATRCGPAAAAVSAVAQFLRNYRFDIAAAGALDAQALVWGGGAGGSV